jgi:hypothetical protein
MSNTSELFGCNSSYVFGSRRMTKFGQKIGKNGSKLGEMWEKFGVFEQKNHTKTGKNFEISPKYAYIAC